MNTHELIPAKVFKKEGKRLGKLCAAQVKNSEEYPQYLRKLDRFERAEARVNPQIL